jgi:hypothetical protein
MIDQHCLGLLGSMRETSVTALCRQIEFTVGINMAGKRGSVTVAAEDTLIAALKVKYQRPDAVIN